MHILKAYERMRFGCETLAEWVGLGLELKDDIEEDTMEGETSITKKANEWSEQQLQAVNNLPDFEVRCQAAKVLLECTSVLRQDVNNIDNSEEKSNANLCLQAAIQVLGSLLAQNDDVVEVWYLLGCAFQSCIPPNVDTARFYWEWALQMLVKLKEDMGNDVDANMSDEELGQEQIQDVNGKIEDVQLQLSELNESGADMCEQ